MSSRGGTSPPRLSRFASGPAWAPRPSSKGFEAAMNLTNFKWDQDAEGIVTLTWDTPDKPVNVLSMAAIAELAQVADTIRADAAIKGLIIASAKPGNFSAGADLDEM